MEPKTLETKNHFGEFQEVNFVKDVYFSGGTMPTNSYQQNLFKISLYNRRFFSNINVATELSQIWGSGWKLFRKLYSYPDVNTWNLGCIYLSQPMHLKCHELMSWIYDLYLTKFTIHILLNPRMYEINPLDFGRISDKNQIPNLII
jgi:hypothetical protein